MYFLILREPTVPQVHTQLIPAGCSGVQGVWRFFFFFGSKENKVWFGPHQTLSQFRGAFTLLDYLYCARTLPLPFNYISMSCPLDICIEAVKHKKSPVSVACAATRKAAGTPWVTANGRAWAATPPLHGAQTVGEKTPAGPPWDALSPMRTSAVAAEDAGTVGTGAARGSPTQTRPASGKRGRCSLPPPPRLG